MSTDANTFDHVIVGGGTAGCLLANRLSADRHKRVLLIEAGGRDDYHWIHIPVATRGATWRAKGEDDFAFRLFDGDLCNKSSTS